MTADRLRIVVVGGGIAGLTAAHVLGADHDVLLLEGSPVVGGKLRLAEVAGVTVDVGAEAMLNRRPEGVELARELGLPVVHPTTATSRVWSRGELRPLPRSLMGVPFDLDELAASGVLSADGLARARAEVVTPWRATTPRSVTWWPPASATRSSTGWSSRCSEVCTPAGHARSPSSPPCPSWPRWPAADR